MKTIVFLRNRGPQFKPIEEEFEFEDNSTDKEIIDAFEDWVWDEVGEEFTWFEKEEDK
ncbi:hypothetical protein [Heyndrickxia coagulans]|uniref:hypothetical protein n=1 Tax=Heyndrickxia coagulans TaxID=1398 RepID=UPI003D19D435